MKEKVEKNNRWVHITRFSTLATILFIAGLIIHLYYAVGDWSFITAFFGKDPIPWIMLLFSASIAYLFYATYRFFKKDL